MTNPIVRFVIIGLLCVVSWVTMRLYQVAIIAEPVLLEGQDPAYRSAPREQATP